MLKDRIACVTIPDFPLQVCCRINRELIDRPVALVESAGESSPLYAVSASAAADGVTLGMTVAQAKTYCPDLIVTMRALKAEAVMAAKLRGKLLIVSPLVEETSPGCYFLDAGGLNWLYKNETELAQKITALVNSLSFPVLTGIGKNKFVAQAAASVSTANSFTLVPTGAERQFLNHQPIDYLPLSSDIKEQLSALGLKTIGQVAAFPSHEMSRRFGRMGTTIALLSRGEDSAFFLPEIPAEGLSRRISFADPTSTARRVLSYLERTLNELFEILSRTDQGTGTVDIVFHLDNNSKQSLRLALKNPVGAPEPFLRQLNSRLNNFKLPGAITDLTVTIGEIVSLVSSQLELAPSTPLNVSSQLFESPTQDIWRQITLLSATLNQAVIPEGNFALLPAAKNKSRRHGLSKEKTVWGHPYALRPITGLRLFQPPRKTEVTAHDGRLRIIKLHGRAKPVVEQKGPWGLSGNWWHHGFDRLYYEIQTQDHQLYLLYFDRQASSWFVQGIFD